MDHFISVIFAKQLNESKRDIVLDTMINTARVGLTEDSVEYELFESENNSTVLRLPLAKPIKEAHQQAFVEALANRLFDKGHTDFEIELSVLHENLLRQGSRGADVKALQAQLGMPAAEQDGIFGPKTEQAVRTFQQSMGLQVDGIVGPQTRASIANSQAAGVATRDAPYNPQEVPQTPTQRRTQQQAPQTAAPQTSPRPQARPAQTTQGPAGGPAPAPSQGVKGSARGMDVDMSGPMDAVRQMAQDQQARFDADDDQPATGPGATPEPLGNTELPTGPGGDQPLPTAQDQRRRQNQDAINPDANDSRAGNTDSGFRAPAPASGAADSAAAQNLAGPAQRGMVQADTPTNNVAPQVQTSVGGLDEPAGSDQAPTISTTDDPEVNQTAPGALQQPAGQQDDTAAFAAATEPAEPGGSGAVLSNNMPPEVFQAAEKTAGDLTSDNVDNLKQTIDNANMPPILSQTTLQYLDQMYPNDDLLDQDVLADASEDERAAAQAMLDLKTSLGGGAQGVNVDTAPPSVDNTTPPVANDTAGGIDADVNAAPAAAPAAPQFHNITQTGRTFRVTDPSGQVVGKSYRSAPQARAAAQALNKEAGAFATNQVDPRPTGMFNNRAKNEWDAQYGITHNRDGSPISETSWNRKPILAENIQHYEVTYHDDDRFHEDYGILWYNDDDIVDEAEYQGRKVKLGKPMKGDVKKFKVYVKNPKGNVVKVNFGQKGVKIKKSNPARRRSFRARHNCDNPGPRHKARYWSCRKW
jgi:hypothetical protein